MNSSSYAPRHRGATALEQTLSFALHPKAPDISANPALPLPNKRLLSAAVREFKAVCLNKVPDLGLFSSQDLLLFYLFFEIGLVPMYFIIGGWGHETAATPR